MANWWDSAPIVAMPAPAQGQTATPAFWADAPLAEGGAPAAANAPPAPPDKYEQAAADKMATLKAAGVDSSYGAGTSAVNGAVLGGLPTIMGALTTPASMIEHGTFDPTEGYSYAKAQQNAELEAGQKKHPVSNTVANLAGGLATGAGASLAGLTMVPKVAGLGATALGMAGDGAAFGALSGALSGEDSGRVSGALEGGALGGVLGGVLPVGAAALKGNPIISNIAARVAPESFASAQLARAIRESGKSPADLQYALDNATAAGQPNFALADALGNSGQRMLSTVTRAPGEGRTAAVDFLENRQAGQAGDVASQLAEALAASRTAAETKATMTAQRGADASVNYGAARSSPGAVDVTPAIAAADLTLQPGVTRLLNPQTGIADNSIESIVGRAKSLLTDGKSNLSDFGQVFQAKQEIDSLIEGATPSQQRALIPIKNALDAQLTKASPAYASARDTFAQQSKAIDAIDQGAVAAQRGRSADTLNTFGMLSPEAQQGFRVGYSDPLIAKAERTAHGANAARPLLNDAQQANLRAMALHNGPVRPGAPDELATRLGRSHTMFETRAHALGGSRTADNLADQSEAAIEPAMVLHLASGNVHEIARGAIGAIGRAVSGSTPAVRSALGKALTMHGAGSDVVGALGPAVAAQIKRAALARAIAGSMFGGAAGVIGGEGNTRR